MPLSLIRSIHSQEVYEFISSMLANPLGIFLFHGDRYVCCDEACIVTELGKVIAIATISLSGEMGEGPSIVGVYVKPDYRRRGYAIDVIERAIERLKERGAADKIHIHVMSSTMAAVLEKLPAEFNAQLNKTIDKFYPLDAFDI